MSVLSRLSGIQITEGVIGSLLATGFLALCGIFLENYVASNSDYVTVPTAPSEVPFSPIFQEYGGAVTDTRAAVADVVTLKSRLSSPSEGNVVESKRSSNYASLIFDPAINVQAARVKRPIFDIDGAITGSEWMLEHITVEVRIHNKGVFQIAKLLSRDISGIDVVKNKKLGCIFRIDWALADKPIEGALGQEFVPESDHPVLIVLVTPVEPYDKKCAL